MTASEHVSALVEEDMMPILNFPTNFDQGLGFMSAWPRGRASLSWGI